MRAFLKRAATCAVGGLVTAAAGLLMMMGIHTNSTTARHEPLLTSSGATTAPVDTVSQVWPPFDNTHSEFKERSRTVGRAGAGMPAIANDAIASLDTSDLKSARPGEVIAYLEQSDGRATVIRATVVDVRQAVGQTRLLLARQEIPNVNEPDSVEEPTRGMRRRFRSNADVFAVYVESTGPQLAAALEQLRRDANFVELRLQPPMDLAHVPVIDPAESPDADAKPRRDASFQLLVNIPEETLRNLDPGVILGSSVNDRPDDRVERAGARLRDHAQSIRGAQPDRVRVLLVFEQRVSG